MVVDVAGSVAWAAAAAGAPGGVVAVLPVAEQCAASMIKRKLAVVGSMCEHEVRCGVPWIGTALWVEWPSCSASCSAPAWTACKVGRRGLVSSRVLAVSQ